MKDTSNRHAIIVGFFVFIGIAFLLAGILMVGNLHETFKKKMQLISLFDDVSGLQKGNNVWFSGVKIGVVSDIRFFGKSQVAVSLKIETKIQQYIRKDAMVKIATDGLIGNKILVIYGGTSAFDEAEAGDTLRVEKTFTSEDMINTLQENNMNVLAISKDFKVLSQKVLQGEGTLGKLLNDNEVYNNMQATTRSLQQASSKAQLLVSNINVYTAGFNRKGTFANDLATDTVVFNNIKRSADKLKQITDTANQLVAKLNEASQNPATTLGVLLYNEESGDHVKNIIYNLDSTSYKLNENMEAIQHSFLFRRYFRKKARQATLNVKKY